MPERSVEEEAKRRLEIEEAVERLRQEKQAAQSQPANVIDQNDPVRPNPTTPCSILFWVVLLLVGVLVVSLWMFGDFRSEPMPQDQQLLIIKEDHEAFLRAHGATEERAKASRNHSLTGTAAKRWRELCP